MIIRSEKTTESPEPPSALATLRKEGQLSRGENDSAIITA